MTGYHKWRNYIQYFFLAFFVFLIFPPWFYQQPEKGIDASWNIAIHLAHKYHLQFGRDFVFTYGPLGILHSRHPISVHLITYLVFDLYFIGTFVFILKDVFRKHFNLTALLFIFLVVIIAMYGAVEEWYFFFFLYFIFSIISGPNRNLAIVQAALLSIICFYFKVSFGIIAVFIYLIAVGYSLIRKKISVIHGMAVLILYLVSIWAGSKLLNVDLKNYFISSLQLISNYNDAMFRPISKDFQFVFQLGLLSILFIACVMIYWFIKTARGRQLAVNLDQLFVYAVIAFSLFIFFKSGAVRADAHINNFFKGLALLTGFLFLFNPNNISKRLTIVCCWFALLVCFFAVNFVPGSYKPYQRILKLSVFPIKFGEIKNYIRGIKNYNRELAKTQRLDSSQNEYKDIIGRQTVDVIPTEISTIYFNGLNYDPRPVIQSYAAYSKYLDELNYNKYMSSTAPDFILFRLRSIDDRFPFFDESKTKLALLNRYSIVGSINGDFVLKKRNAANLLKFNNNETVKAKFGEDIIVKETKGIQFSQIHVNYNAWGKLKRIFYQPPTLKITFTFENGETETYRAIKPVLASGVILNKYIDTDQEFQFLMQSEGRENKNVKKFRIEAERGRRGFENEINIENSFWSFNEKTASEKLYDSLSLEKLLDVDNIKYRPLSLDPASVETDTAIKYGIDFLKVHSKFISAEGWAFRDKANNEKLVVKAVLKSGDKLYELPTEQRPRPDLGPVFNRKDLANAGFNAIASKTTFPPGDYQLGVMVADSIHKRKWLAITDQHFLIKNNYELRQVSSVSETVSSQKRLQFDIQPIEEDDEHYFVKGWAAMKNMNSKGSYTKLLLRFKDLVYELNTDVVFRQDVIDYFKNPLLGYSGFYTEIPKNKLPGGVYTLGVEKVYSIGEKQFIKFSNSKIRVNIPEVFMPLKVDDELPVVKEFHTGLDQLIDSGDIMNIRGWAIDNINEVEGSSIEIVLMNDKAIYVSETELNPRPDVTAHFKSKIRLDDCGFVAKISKAPLVKGKYKVGIIISRKGERKAVKFLNEYIYK